MSSPNVHKVSIMLEELGLGYNFHFVDLPAGEQFEPKFLAISPLGKAPAIIDSEGPDGVPYSVFESGAILIYLATKYERFLPLEGAAYFDVMKWLMLQKANVGPIFGQLTHFTRFAPADNSYSRSRYFTMAGRIYDALDVRLGDSPYLAGPEYSVADIATYPWVSLYHEKHGMAWADHPHLRAWCDRVASRPAVARADELYQSRLKEEPTEKPNLPRDGVNRIFGWGRYARNPGMTPG